MVLYAINKNGKSMIVLQMMMLLVVSGEESPGVSILSLIFAVIMEGAERNERKEILFQEGMKGQVSEGSNPIKLRFEHLEAPSCALQATCFLWAGIQLAVDKLRKTHQQGLGGDRLPFPS